MKFLYENFYMVNQNNQIRAKSLFVCMFDIKKSDSSVNPSGEFRCFSLSMTFS